MPKKLTEQEEQKAFQDPHPWPAHRLDVLRVGGVRSDAVLVHQRDEVGLRQQRGRLGLALVQVDRGGLELEDGLVVGDLLVRPTLVRVHLKVVAMHHGQAVANELGKKNRRYV